MSKTDLACPSANPDTPNARVFAVIGGTAEAPRASYLAKGVDVPEALQATPEGILPTRIFRFTGTCQASGCQQFANGNCQLGKTVNRLLEPASDEIPACTIRANCRWFAENGSAICLKCPQVVTTLRPSEPDLLAVLAQVDTGHAKQLT